MTPDELSLYTDLYQLTMLESYLAEGLTDEAIFDLSVRRLPLQRNFLLMAGVATVADYLQNLRFGAKQLAYLESTALFSQTLLDYLRGFRFTGDLLAVPEGTVVFAGEPLLQVIAPLPQAQLVETYLLNQVTLQTTLASKGARVVRAAQGRAVVDFGARRTQGTDAGLQAARSLYLAGFEATSNVQAGQRYGIPISGTMAHAYVQAHDTELDAFRAFARRYPEGTLLVDTYDTNHGVANVVALSRELGSEFHVSGIRLDSGDLSTLATEARSILNEAGLAEVRIFASGGLDEYAIADLVNSGTPIDGFGVGTNVGTSVDAPTLESVYKLVSYAGVGRLKTSTGKATLPWRKQIFRQNGADGAPSGDTVGLSDEMLPGEALLQPVILAGDRCDDDLSLAAARARAATTLALVPHALHSLQPTSPYPVTISDALHSAADRSRAAQAGSEPSEAPDMTIEPSSPQPDQPLHLASEEEKQAYRESVRKKTRRKGLVIVHTGDGKGKTTAAFGLAFRAAGRGMRVSIIQFIKPDAANYGELRAARQLGIEIEGTGDGWTWNSTDLDETARLAVRGWQLAQERIESGDYDVVVLDEFTYPMAYGWLDPAAVVTWLRHHKPPMAHVVITGRDAPVELLDFADLVTEMREIKHPFADQGIRAQPGIEF